MSPRHLEIRKWWVLGQSQGLLSFVFRFFSKNKNRSVFSQRWKIWSALNSWEFSSPPLSSGIHSKTLNGCLKPWRRPNPVSSYTYIHFMSFLWHIWIASTTTPELWGHHEVKLGLLEHSKHCWSDNQDGYQVSNGRGMYTAWTPWTKGWFTSQTRKRKMPSATQHRVQFKTYELFFPVIFHLIF